MFFNFQIDFIQVQPVHRRLHRADPGGAARIVLLLFGSLDGQPRWGSCEQGRVQGRRAPLRGQLEDHRQGIPQPTAGQFSYTSKLPYLFRQRLSETSPSYPCHP